MGTRAPFNGGSLLSVCHGVVCRPQSGFVMPAKSGHPGQLHLLQHPWLPALAEIRPPWCYSSGPVARHPYVALPVCRHPYVLRCVIGCGRWCVVRRRRIIYRRRSHHDGRQHNANSHAAAPSTAPPCLRRGGLRCHPNRDQPSQGQSRCQSLAPHESNLLRSGCDIARHCFQTVTRVYRGPNVN